MQTSEYVAGSAAPALPEPSAWGPRAHEAEATSTEDKARKRTNNTPNIVGPLVAAIMAIQIMSDTSLKKMRQVLLENMAETN